MKTDIEKAIREYLPDVIHMSLATCKGGRPWVCEVHYAFDNDLNLYFRSLTSRRHSQEIASNPQVAGSIVRQFVKGEPPIGIYFEGAAELLTVVNAEHPAYKALNGRFASGQKILDEAARPDGHQFYKVTVENWYVFGNLDGKAARKYQLTWHGIPRTVRHGR